MKKIKLFAILLLMSHTGFSQIDPFLGIHDYDSCKFESQCHLLVLDTSSQNIWQIGKPVKLFFDSAYSRPFALITDTINPYPNSVHSSFDLKIPSVYYGNMIVGFKHMFQTDTLTDGGYIQISYDMGQSWIDIIHDTLCLMFNSENLYTNADTLLGGINGFSGTSSGWIYTRVQWVWALPVKTYPPDTLIMRFNFISDNVPTGKAGWMIDDVLVSFTEMGGSVEETDWEDVSLIISPNPADNYTTISFDNVRGEGLSMIMCNSLGQRVRELDNITGTPIRIEKGDLPGGLYFVQLRNDQEILATSKLIIK